MAEHKPDPIYFLITDLAASATGPGSQWSRLKRHIPFKSSGEKKPSKHESKKFLHLYHFAPFKHWAVKIRNFCYEVNVYHTPEGKRAYRLNNRMCFEQWKKNCETIHVSWEPIEVGATAASDDFIEKQADMVWKDRCQVKYKLWAQNCQNFAYCLYRRVAVDPDAVDADVRQRWKGIPNRATQLKTFAQKVAPMLGRGLMVEGLELGAEGLAVLGLEIVGLSLLGPVGEIILITSIAGSLFFMKNKDTRWLKKVNKAKKNPSLVGDTSISEYDVMTEIEMEELLKDMVRTAEKIETPPSGRFDHWSTPEEFDTAVSGVPQHDDFSRYQGYDKESVDRYARLGFAVEHVVAVLIEWDISTGGGEEFKFNEADHELLIQSLLGRHGFDKTVSYAKPTIPRKPLPVTAMIDQRLLVPGDADAPVPDLPVRKMAQLTSGI